jgi:hypothetical protein
MRDLRPVRYAIGGQPLFAISCRVQAKIDELVSASLRSGDGLYGIDNAAVARAQPDLIITQDLCSVCAPSSRHVASALEAITLASTDKLSAVKERLGAEPASNGLNGVKSP